MSASSATPSGGVGPATAPALAAAQLGARELVEPAHDLAGGRAQPPLPPGAAGGPPPPPPSGGHQAALRSSASADTAVSPPPWKATTAAPSSSSSRRTVPWRAGPAPSSPR